MARHMRCFGCMRRFRPKDFATIESGAGLGVFQLRCPMCGAQRLVIAVWNERNVRTFLTELDAQEWVFYRNGAPISSDDVIRVYQMLEGYDGDLSDVLEDPLFD